MSALARIRDTLRGDAAGIVMATGVTHSITFVQEMLIARRFGISSDLDAYLFAMGCYQFMANVLTSSVAPSVVPVLGVVRRARGMDGAAPLLRRVSGLILVQVGLVTGLAFMLSPAIPRLAGGFTGAQELVASRAFCVLAPLLLGSAFAQTWELLLATEGSPVASVLLPALRPITLATGLSIVGEPRVEWLAWLLLLGQTLELGVAGTLLARRGWHLTPSISPIPRRGDELYPALRQYASLVSISLLTSLSAMTDQMMAARLAPGSIATLSYASRLTAPFVVVAATLTSGLFFPRALDHVARRDVRGLDKLVRKGVGMAGIGAAIPVVVLWLVAVPVVRLLYSGGQFDSEAVGVVAGVMRVASLHVPFAVMSNVVNRALLARSASHRLIRGTLAFPILNLVLDILFARMLGVAGIALATVCTNAFGLGLFYVTFRNEIRDDLGRDEAPPIPGSVP